MPVSQEATDLSKLLTDLIKGAPAKTDTTTAKTDTTVAKEAPAAVKTAAEAEGLPQPVSAVDLGALLQPTQGTPTPTLNAPASPALRFTPPAPLASGIPKSIDEQPDAPVNPFLTGLGGLY